MHEYKEAWKSVSSSTLTKQRLLDNQTVRTLHTPPAQSCYFHGAYLVGGVKEWEHFPQRYVELLKCRSKNRWGFRIQLGCGVEHELESVRLKILQEAETVV